MTNQRVVKSIYSKDGKRCVPGRFVWVPAGPSGYSSGIYETAELAEREARSMVPWLANDYQN